VSARSGRHRKLALFAEASDIGRLHGDAELIAKLFPYWISLTLGPGLFIETENFNSFI